MNRQDLTEYLNILYFSAKEAYDKGEIPVSSLLVFPDGTFIAERNHVEERNDPFCHAEYNVIQKGLEKTKGRYLKGCTLLVSLEPCLFCMGALLKAGIEELYYVLDDEKKGSLSHYHAFVDDTLHVHRVEDSRFLPLMNAFFKKLR